MSEYHGHKTMLDGSHIPLSEDEAKALWKMAEDQRAARATTMPTAEDALRSLIAAEERLRELGWSRGGGLRVRRGDMCAVAEQGSTGMWTGSLDEEGTYVHYGDSVSSPRKCFLKPLADLTPEERAHMERCDQNERVAFEAMMGRYASMSEAVASDDVSVRPVVRSEPDDETSR